MEEISIKSKVWIAMLIGSAWGLSEVLIGMLLKGTSVQYVNGSIMTGVAVLFISLAYGLLGKSRFLLIPLLMVIVLKLIDAFMLHLPVVHTSISNPIYAMVTELLVFVLIFSIIKNDLLNKIHGLAIAGALYAIVAVTVFPLVKYFTGVPACVVAGTNYPLALYYSPVAVALSAVTVPFGALMSARIGEFLFADKVLPEKYSFRVDWILEGCTIALVAIAVLVRL